MREVWPIPSEDRLRNTGSEWVLAIVDSSMLEEVANLTMVLWRACPSETK
jgi:hypothetical protein